MKIAGICALFIVIVGCSPSSSEDFLQEGESLCLSLTKELKNVHTREDLLKMTPLLKKRFMQFAELVMAARAFQRQHAGEAMPEIESDFLASEALLEEMKRIYAIEGGRKIIEDAEREALFALDAYLKNLDKDKVVR